MKWLILNINTVNKYYGDVHVIKDISLDVKSQSFTVLVGPSGCGKSTMLANDSWVRRY